MTTHHTAAAGSMLGEPVQRETRDHTTIAHGGGLLLLASAFGNGLNYVFGIVLARTLGPDEFGLYALALTIFNMISLTVVFGMDVGMVKFISHHLAEGQQAKARDTIVAAATLSFGTGLVAAGALALCADPIAVGLYNKPELVVCLLLFSLAIPLVTVTSVLISALQAHQTVRSTILIKYLWEPIGKFLLAGGLVWAGFELLGVLAALVFVFLVSATLAMVGVYRRIASGADGPTSRLHEAKTLVAYCLPLTISNVFGVVAPRTDIILLGYWMNTQEIGVYLAAFQTAAILSLVLGAFVTGAAPVLSRAWSQHGLVRLQDSYQTVARLSVTISLPIFCGLILFAEDILGMFGPEFVVGMPALIVLAVGQIVSNATGSANTVLLMTGHSRLVMTNTIIMGLVLLVATTISIPLWGVIGAALAASGTFVVTNVVRMIQVWKLLHVQPYTWELIKPVAASIGASLVVSSVSASGVTVHFSVLWALLAVLYLGGLLLLKINLQDRLAIQSLISRLNPGMGRT